MHRLSTAVKRQCMIRQQWWIQRKLMQLPLRINVNMQVPQLTSRSSAPARLHLLCCSARRCSTLLSALSCEPSLPSSFSRMCL